MRRVEVIGAISLLGLGSLVGGGGVWQYIQANRSEREVALEGELKALRTAQRLSIATWRARHQMHVVDSFDPEDAA